jgi:hypothetical protein
VKAPADREVCRACRKRLYAGKREAKRASASMHQRFRVYPCPAGQGWHVAKEQR